MSNNTPTLTLSKKSCTLYTKRGNPDNILTSYVRGPIAKVSLNTKNQTPWNYSLTHFRVL